MNVARTSCTNISRTTTTTMFTTAITTSANSSPHSPPSPRELAFPHCGEKRLVSPPPQSLLAGLGPGHWIEAGDDRQAGAFILRGPAVDENPPLPPTPDDAAAGDCRTEGRLELQPPDPGESVASMARRLEDDGMLYLPGLLKPGRVAALRATMDSTATDPGNPVDSGIGTKGWLKAKESGTPFYDKDKGVMSWWNRDPDALSVRGKIWPTLRDLAQHFD
jgi:hypothetical protein